MSLLDSCDLPTEPLAYFLTWTTYGTWLPGDDRGWVLYRRGWRLPDPVRELEARMRLQEDACILDCQQRAVVEQCIRDHCGIRGWILHEVNCRSNHCHCVITAPVDPDIVRMQLKAWTSRRLKQLEALRNASLPPEERREVRKNWWAERGSCRFVYSETSLENVILYVRDGQDRPRS